MQATIHDREALKAISPVALAAYARSAGWQRGETLPAALRYLRWS